MNIVTVTPNVAIDQTVVIDKLSPGEVHRARSVAYTPGGKGVNVSSCLADWGLKSRATGFLGQDNAMIFEKLCQEKDIEDAFIRIPGLSRMNIKLVDVGGTTDINLPGMVVTEAHPVDAILERASQGNPGCQETLVIMAGSLPQGCPVSFYRDLTRRFSDQGYKVLLDASDEALRQALAPSVPRESLPFMVKPNRLELSEWAGKSLDSLKDIIDAAEALHERGIALVAVSLGEEGALFYSNEGVVSAKANAPDIVSTVGAGDAMVSGLAAAFYENASLERTARLASAFAVAKLGLLGPNLPDKDRVEELTRTVRILAL